MRALAASPLGFLIGLSIGALGGGGSILAVPVLVYVAGRGLRAATTTSLVIVGLAAWSEWRTTGVRDGCASVLAWCSGSPGSADR